MDGGHKEENKMDIKQVLQIALDFEKKGQEIYYKTAEKTQNPIVKKTFNYLAQQELLHIEEIKDYIKENKINLGGDNLKKTKQFFAKTTQEFKNKTELSKDDEQAHIVALEMEKEAYNFYEEQLVSADDEELKAFLEFLMEQENAHYELIQKSLDFIKNPEGFLAGEEGWLFEG